MTLTKTQVAFLLLLFLFFSVFSQSTLVPKGANWKYLDTGIYPGSNWMTPSFNDNTWPSGAAKLGYNEGDVQTTLSFGGDSQNKHISYYFRKTFSVTNANAHSFGYIIKLLRDDGAIVYLNGVEVLRSNFPIGPIDHTTRAGRTSSGAEEDLYFESSIASSYIQEGVNTIAVELHQNTPSSSDLAFDLELIPATGLWLSRTPYLQNVSTDFITVRWQTSIPAETRLTFGNAPGNQPNVISDPVLKRDHEVKITGLAAATQYYYSIKVGTETLANGFDHYFHTSPAGDPGTPIDLWLIGDSGTGRDAPRNTFQAYKNMMGANRPELFLLMGDNAYDFGSDRDYQEAFFEVFPDFLRNIPSYSCPGNHDYYTYGDQPDPVNDPFFNLYTFPQNGEAGGFPSGSELYYSFDYGHIHVISVTTEDYAMEPSSPMGQWLANDLIVNNGKWTLVLLHSPPYTKGSFNSDQSQSAKDVREHLLPVLEAGGVDMVFSADSHVFERSKMINGHYGLSNTFNAASMLVQAGDGKEEGGCSYRKYTTGPNADKGTIYCVLGSTGRAESGPFDHPVMQYGAGVSGSMAVSILENRLDFKFLSENGTILDYFTLHKDAGNSTVVNLDPGASATLTTSWVGTYNWSTGGSTARSISVSPATPTTYIVTDNNGCVSDTFLVQPSGTPTTVSFSTQLAFSEDDAEEGLGSGYVNLTSSDLEIVDDGSREQCVGVRFRGLNIPQGVTITNAYIQFMADETDSNPTTLTLKGDASDNSPEFIATNFNLTQRILTNQSVSWNPNPWTVVGETGPDQRTPNLSGIIQEIIARQGWAPGNAISIIFQGIGERTAESFEGGSAKAAILFIEYLTSGGPSNLPPTANIAAIPQSGSVPLFVSFDGANSSDPDGTVASYSWDFGDGSPMTSATSTGHLYTTIGQYTAQLTVTDDMGATGMATVLIDVQDTSSQVITSAFVNSTSDDAEERTSNGFVTTTSSDLELGQDGTKVQIVGMRFSGLNIPAGSSITNAYIQFTTDETNSGQTSLTFRGEATDDAQPFQAVHYNLSTRNVTSNSVFWSPPVWSIVNEAGLNQQTPNLKNILQEIIDRPGYTSASAVVFFADGVGERTAESHKSSRDVGPQLWVSYTPPSSSARIARTTFWNKRVYPNPFTDEFYIRIQDEDIEWVDVKMLDLNGQVVFQQEEIPTDNPISLGKGLPMGMYIIQLSTEGLYESVKVVKVK